MRCATILVLLATSQVVHASPDSLDEPDHEDDIDDAGLPMLTVATRVAGPPIGAVLSAAHAAAGLDRDPGRGWVVRARLAGLIPWVSLRTGRNTSWENDDPAVGHSSTIEVRATWRLDRLVFDGRELQVASIESARRRERRRLASQVIRTYFVWRRAVSASISQPRWTSLAEQAAAELDAATDGWFSEAVAEHRREASGDRTP